MQNSALVADYLQRSQHRLAAVAVLYDLNSWADVVRESQEIVELSLKALLRQFGIEPPRMHDVGPILLDNPSLFAPSLTLATLERMAKISHDLRRDRELAFYGSEDLTPGGFYGKSDATAAKEGSTWVVETVRRACGL